MGKKRNSGRESAKWIVFATMPFQMGVVIYLFHLLGQWLQSKTEAESEWVYHCLVLLGIFVALYQVISQVKRFNKDKNG